MKSSRTQLSVKPRVLVCEDGAAAPEWIQLIPGGEVKSAWGDFICDAAAMETVIAAFVSLERDMVVDYEHQTLTGQEAPAAGWLDQLEARDDGLWGHVNWTERGRSYVASKEYRYLSPVIWVRDSDRRVIELDSVALTNDPAIRGMRPLVNARRRHGEEEDAMKWAAVLAALGLTETADEAEALGAVERLSLTRGGVVKALGLGDDAAPADVEAKVTELVAFRDGAAELLELGDDRSPETARGRLLALKNPAGQVSAAEYDALKRRLDERDRDDLVELALKEGKVTPANRGWAERYALKDPAGFRAFLKDAPKVVPLERVVQDGASSGSGLDEAERLVCSQLGIDEAEFKKNAG